MLFLSKKVIKKKKEIFFFPHYRKLFIKTLNNIDLKVLEKVSKVIEKK